ncbi:telomerase Cajal body protein 1 [Cucurbita moschata]|uniref:Telomerase Cajal body protein 1 n=1 Tax=Cucurbita moschata TaxID=3662 RepID=A0A6J1EGT9_CUCMO|nr:telomerase Cajal body protein 1 [Cucurbita moschata]
MVNKLSSGKLSKAHKRSPSGLVLIDFSLKSLFWRQWRNEGTLDTDCCLGVLAMSETESMLVEEEENRSNPAGEAAEAAMNDEEQQSYSWPVIQFNSPPQRTYHFYNQFRTGPNPNNFFKGVKWSPDGSCFLTSSEDNSLRRFNLPDYGNDVSGNVAGEEDSFTSNLVVGEGESVYDFCWYPYMSASDPVTCVFASTTRDHPIHLWDAASGELRCTYRAYDAMDEITAAFSISFNPAGTKAREWLFGCLMMSSCMNGVLFILHRVMSKIAYKVIIVVCVIFAGAFEVDVSNWSPFSPNGFQSVLTGATVVFFAYVGFDAVANSAEESKMRIFDLHRPGRDFGQHSTLQGNKEGQTGIISAIAFSPTHNGMLALGSYSQTTGIYREDNMELLYVLHGQEGGITHIQFSKDGNYLYTGGRKDPYILCWDIRKSVDVVYKLYRSSEHTNQRIFFDIEPCGQHLGTGGQDGFVHVYDLQTGQWVTSFQAAQDTVNGFSFHPYMPMTVTSSGHRRFIGPDNDDGDLCLRGDENCASVWSFNFASSGDGDAINTN